MPNYCKYCGNKLMENQRFCIKCGNEIRNKKDVADNIVDFEKRMSERTIAYANSIEEIVIKAQNGEHGAFDELYEVAKPYVYFNISKLGDIPQEDVFDLMQEIYLKIYKNLDTIINPKTSMKWIKMITHNHTVDYLRKSKNRNEKLVKENQDFVFEQEDEIRQPIPIPENILDNKEIQKLVQTVLQELPEEEYKILLAYYFNESKISNIAVDFEMPESTVKTKLKRSRDLLKDKFSRLEKEQGIRLHAVGMAPLMLYIFNMEAEATVVPNEISRVVKAKVFATDLLNDIMKQSAQRQKQAMVKPKARMVQTSVTHSVTKAAVGTKVLAGVLAVAVISGTSTTLYHNYIKSTPEKTMEQFATAFNDNDVNAMVECLDNEVQDTYDNIENTVLNLIGFTPQDIVDEVVGVTDLDNKKDMLIEVEKVNYVSDTTSYADCRISFEGESEEETIKLIKEDKKWHIDIDMADFL